MVATPHGMCSLFGRSQGRNEPVLAVICDWWPPYSADGTLIDVQASAQFDPMELTLEIQV